MSESVETYFTTDFYTTAILIAKKFIIKEVKKEKNNGRLKYCFHFDDTQELRDTLLSYVNRQLECNARDFRDAIETVKDMVHSA